MPRCQDHGEECDSHHIACIAGDLECWTCGTQELAADFLVTLLIFAEDNITMHLQPLVKLLHKALSHLSIESKLSFSHL
jgi:hypothetical protein